MRSANLVAAIAPRLRGTRRWTLALLVATAAVAAVGGAGGPTARGAPARALAPVPPTALTATATNGRVTLDWADNTDIGLAGYNVFRSTSSPVSTASTP